LIDKLHLRLLTRLGKARASDLNQCLPQRHDQRDHKTRIGDPDTINVPEAVDALGQSTRDQDGDLGVCGALIRTELGKPAITPVLRSLDSQRIVPQV
jgi:hypothetical protein